MKKHILTAVCALALVACLVTVAAAANTAATIGNQSYASLQTAVDNSNSDLIKLVQDADTLSVTKDTYIDLNGCNIQSVTVESGTLYVMDSQTDDYTVADGKYGKIANYTGSVACLPVEADCAADGYLMVAETDGTSFHRVDLQIYAMTLRAGRTGVYYKSNFAGDELVAANVRRFGIAMSIVEAPTAENLSQHGGMSWFSNFKSGAGSNAGDATSTLLYNIMAEGNTDLVNRTNADYPIYGRAYIQTTDGNYLFGDTVCRSLKEQVELTAEDAVWSDLTPTQVSEVVSMYRKYAPVLRNWDVANIESALVLDQKDPLAPESGELKVLAITSSFGLNTTQMLYDVAVAEGYAPEKVTVGRLYTSGCTLVKHLTYAPDKPVYQYTKVTGDPNKTSNPGKMMTLYSEGNATLLDGLLDEDWDVIFMQQGAAQAPQLNTYTDANGNNYIDQLRAIVDTYKTNPDARFVWNMLWGYQSDSTIDPFPRLFNSDQMYMYQCNIDAVMKYVVPRTDYDRIIPTGTVIQNARSSEFGDNLCRDTYHLNNYGGIMAAYGLYSVITGQKLTEINIDAVAVSALNGIGGAAKITEPLTDTQKAIIIDAVNNALEDPFHLTQSKYPVIDYSAYKPADNLVFDEGTNRAVCTACQQKVSWIEVSQALLDAENSTIASYFGNTIATGAYHFYLSSDISYTAASTSGAFLNASAGGRNICLHLNGNDLTAENCAVGILAGNSVLNIMGSGEVIGNHTHSQKFRGSAIILNAGTTTSNPGIVRLYSGTYIQPATNGQLAPVSAAWQGGLLEIYEDATLTGNANNYSLCLNTTNGNATSKYNEAVNIYGGTFNRPVHCEAYNTTVTTPATTLNISGGTFNDGIEIISNTDVALSGAPMIRGNGLILPEGLLIELGELESDASILVKATGIFTTQTPDARAYASLFSPAENGYAITVANNALKYAERSAYNYTENLVFNAGTTNAVCPSCQKEVSWIEVGQSLLDAENSTIAKYFGSSITAGTYHFYLSSDISYTAASTSGAFLNAPGGGRNICLHLNGNDLTAQNCAAAILAGNSVLNVMGNGQVIGNHTHTLKYRGSAIILNAGTTTNPGTVRLYSGTYIQPEGNTQLAPVSTAWQGGLLEIYEDATLTGNSSNYSLCINSTNGNASNKYTETVNIHGGIFNRPVYCKAFDAVTTPATALNISGGIFNDGIEIVSNTDVTLSGAPVIRGSGLILPENLLIGLGELESGASILVKASGIFTTQNQNASSYAPLFTPVEDDYFITVANNALQYVDCSALKHTDNLVFDAGTTNAFCTACGEKVTWTALNQDNHSSVITRPALPAGNYHFYLSSDITYTASSTSTEQSFIRSISSASKICLHLNSHNLTATNNCVLTIAGTKINIMGNGTVTGNATMTGTNANRGTTLQMNSSVASSVMNIYSGTYKSAAGSANTSVVSGWVQGGTINIYDDATIIGNGKHCVYLNTENTQCTQTLNIYGGNFSNGDIYLDGTTSANTKSKTTFNLMGGNIAGGISVLGNTNLTIGGAPVVSGTGLKLASGITATLAQLKAGASIAVDASGAFTVANTSAASYLSYFKAVKDTYTITAQNNILYCNAK